MAAWRWTLLDEDGNEMRSTDEFSSRADAEDWLSRSWSGLTTEGAASVSLRSEGEEVYEMSLAPE